MARPPGSTAEVHKVRRDYRFAPQTMQYISQGIGTLKETAFVEQAIAYYAQFLAGGRANQETERLQEQVNTLEDARQDALQRPLQLEERLRDLERQYSQALDHIREGEYQLQKEQARVRALESALRQARAATPKPEEKGRALSKAYQIKVRHEPHHPCPALPQGFAYDESEITDSIRAQNWGAHTHTVHIVLTQHWPLARMRKEVERLKGVPGLLNIWIEKNGEPVKAGSGYATDSWVKQEGTWIRA